MDYRNLPSRRTIRLQSYDYASPGYYFVTICTREKKHLFGEIRDGVMYLNASGGIALYEWHRTESIRDNVQLDAFVVMPDHIHGIIQIVKNVGARVGSYHDLHPNKNDVPDVGTYRDTSELKPTQNRVNVDTSPNKHNMAGVNVGTYRDTSLRSPSNNLGAIVRGYKSAVTKRINVHRNTPGTPVWQRNYYEHIIRDENGLFRIREYIRNNPKNWGQGG